MTWDAGQIITNLGAVGDAVRAAAARGLADAAEHILGASNDIVPLDEGHLERSGATAVDPGTLTAAVGYNTPYAVRQHEELGYRHLNGREAKFLEKALARETSQVGDIIADAIREVI